MRVLTEPEIVAAAPSFLNPKRNWSGKCEAAAFNLADAFTPGEVRSFPSATAARKASKIEGPGFGPPGAWVWMSNVWVTENGVRYDAGHVAYHLGNNLLYMASASVRKIPGFTALGFIDGLLYLRLFSNQKLEGWSRDHGGTIIPTPTQEDDDMKLTDIVEVDDGRGGKQKVYYGALLNHLFVHVTAAADAAKVAAAGSRDQPFPSTVLVDSAGNPQPVTMGILADHTRVILGSVDARITALTAAVQSLAEAKGLDATALTELIAAKVDEALQDDFQAIPDTIAASIAN